MSEEKVRVRFAPSPTGYLHVGGARTALYDYLYAKNRGGTFVLRIEDTDEARSTEEALRMQIQDLQWLGLKWDEGVDPVTLEDRGPHGPYRQSQRKEIYREHAEKLLESGQAYYCFLTDAEIEEQKKRAMAESKPYQITSPYRDLPRADAEKRIAAGETPSVRFKVPQGKTEYVFKDLVRGEVKFPSDMVGDFVILRSGGMPVYNFCCAIDDALMKMTHVFRAEEHLSNTLRQMMIYEAFGYSLPKFGHLSIVLGEDRQKLSKRHGATSCNEYRVRGYLPEALKNFIALLGWSSPEGQEVLSEEEMIRQFTVERLNPASAVFDEKKLLWMNATHLRELPHAELWKRLTPLFDEAKITLPSDSEWQDRALSVFKTSMETLNDAIELFRPLSDEAFQVSEEASEALSWESTTKVLAQWKSEIEKLSANYMSEEEFSSIQNQVKKDCEVKGKQLFMPIRVAVIGKPHGAELKVLVPLLSRDSLLKRVSQVMKAQ